MAKKNKSEPYRHYDLVEAYLSSRKRTLLRRSLSILVDIISTDPDTYMAEYDINSSDTVKTHLTDVRNLRSELNL